MAGERASSASAEDTVPHFVRITTGGKIRHWVEFCLKFFHENPGRPLVLHTLLKNPSQVGAAPSTNSASSADAFSKGEANAQPHSPEGTEPKTATGLHSAARNIPRLISIVEIIKREYFKELTPGPTSTGLYQYNQIGSVEESAAVRIEDEDDEKRQNAISTVLRGKRFLKQEKSPYMKITLCTSAVPSLEKEATRQVPPVKKLSRSARARRKRRSLRSAEKQEEKD